MPEYKVAKKIYRKNEILSALLVFDNGDYIPIVGTEIDDVSVRLYDKLILENDELCAVAESGFLKLSIQEKPKKLHTEALVYNPEQYHLNRKLYIENRLKTEGGLIGIRFIFENNWHTTVFGMIVPKIEDGTVYLEYLPKPFPEPYEHSDHVVYLNTIKKSLIRSIELDFENCESFTVYCTEILDIHLNLKQELAWSSHDYYRVVKDGYIVLKIEDDSNRQINFLDDYSGRASRKILERRLCGKNGHAIHDICHLYIRYMYSGFGKRNRECLEIEDIRSDEEIEEMERKEAAGIGCCFFAGGKCTRQTDGTILITFGKNKKESN